jgi:hypothetical protein
MPVIDDLRLRKDTISTFLVFMKENAISTFSVFMEGNTISTFSVFMEGNTKDSQPLFMEENAISTFLVTFDYGRRMPSSLFRCLWKGMPPIGNRNLEEIIPTHFDSFF